MRRALLTIVLFLGAIPALPPCQAGHTPANRPLVLAHYMPWFVAKPASNQWGWHWTMNTFHPETIKNGKRQIASRYYPLIGPYDSGDPAVLEYHLLLMKLAGIDGVIVDWYGLSDSFDYAVLHRNTEAVFRRTAQLGLKFAVCYEDQTIPKLIQARRLSPSDRVKHAREELQWLRKHWFAAPNYVHLHGKPLLLSFGYGGLTDKEWDAVFQGLAPPVLYVSEHQRRSQASGAFDWPVPGEYPTSLDRFYQHATLLKPAIPVAFPRFDDVYQEGQSQPHLARIPDNGGRTWAATLERALKSTAPVIQLATWNDWGEGTGIEPTVELGYRDLVVLQRLQSQRGQKDRGGKPSDLRLPYRLYLSRQAHRERPESKQELDAIATLLARGWLSEARRRIERLEKR